jgi:hypothetical protein
MNVGEMKRMIAAAARSAREQSADRFLIDCRQMSPALSVMDVYYLAAGMAQLGVSRNHVAAIVWCPSANDKRLAQFYSDRAHNLGFEHRFFMEEQDALTWLRQARF